MSKKREEKKVASLKAQKKKFHKKLIIAFIASAVVIGGIIIVANSASSKENHVHITLDANGDAVIPTSAVGEGLNYYQYEGSEELLVWKDSNGVYYTAFDTCVECFSSGAAHYTLNGDTLTCENCGSTMSVTNLGKASWGGCQPVSIPMEYRQDTESEIVIPSELLTYSAEVFEAWENSDFSISLENYGS